MNRGNPENRNRLSWWFPRLPSDIPVPKTVIIPYTGTDLMAFLDGEIPSTFSTLCIKIQKAGEKLGWPLFLRTDYLSGKHNWKNTCYVPGPECVQKRVISLVEESAMADMTGFPTDCWIAREFIPTNPVFHAFRGDMPIVKERRYFVRDGKVLCHHPYWPAEAFEGHNTSVDRWIELLARMNDEDVDEVELLSTLSSDVGVTLGGEWSIDWLWSEKDYRWYLIDMAEAWGSYHWPTCRNAT